MFTSKYIVSGMTCENCVKHVTEEVMAVSGVSEVALTVEGDLRVTSHSELTLDAVKEAVEEAGDYQVVPA